MTESSTNWLNRLIDGFNVTCRASSKTSVERGKIEAKSYSELIENYTFAISRVRASQRHTAVDFNLVNLLGVERDERRHRDVLAWLVSKDPFDATHAQGSDGFRSFLEAINLPREYADFDYFVRCEVKGANSRIDLEIGSASKFIVHIEIKIDAEETVKGENETLQLTREKEDLEARRKRLGVPISATHALLLSKHHVAHSGFRRITWYQVADAFEKFGNSARAESVKWFALHYATALRRCINVRMEVLNEHNIADDK